MPLPHVKQATGGQVFPNIRSTRSDTRKAATCGASTSISTCPTTSCRSSRRRSSCTTHPELGDVSRGQVVTINNFYELFKGILTPVQLEGLRLLLTPFPQEEFNPTDDRKSRGPEPGRHLPRLPRQRPHQRGLPPDARTSGRRPRASGSTRRACAACSTSRSTARSGPCARSRTSPSSSSAPPTSTATTSARQEGREPARPHRTRSR